MFRAIVLTFILLFPVVPSHAQPVQSAASVRTDDSAAAPTFSSAKELAGKGRLDQALAQLDQLAAHTPEPAGVERLRGIILYQREDYPEATEAFTKAALQDPTDKDSIEMHGVILFRQGRIPEAIPFL